ncbi:MAG: polyprenyl diphosphate synthase [Clostridia bacterium]|jgi:undecaprenyl diphosphate synthase|nr:polyprenyl diphosphate synthase [Clostridia bacterium]
MKHISIIMDGNGRWASQKGMPRLSGHFAAKEAVIEMIDAAEDLKIPVLSLYAFSEDNFKRDASEVLGIFGIISDFISQYLIPLAKNRNYKLVFIGNISLLPDPLLSTISIANKATLNNIGMKIIIAIAYSGRAEITHAFNSILENKLINADYSPIEKSDIVRVLYTATVPDPDIIIRYGGQRRLSDFMLYQSAYTELFFLEKLFPDANKKDIYEIVNEYKKIKRNYGDVIK